MIQFYMVNKVLLPHGVFCRLMWMATSAWRRVAFLQGWFWFNVLPDGRCGILWFLGSMWSPLPQRKRTAPIQMIGRTAIFPALPDLVWSTQLSNPKTPDFTFIMVCIHSLKNSFFKTAWEAPGYSLLSCQFVSFCVSTVFVASDLGDISTR